MHAAARRHAWRPPMHAWDRPCMHGGGACGRMQRARRRSHATRAAALSRRCGTHSGRAVAQYGSPQPPPTSPIPNPPPTHTHRAARCTRRATPRRPPTWGRTPCCVIPSSSWRRSADTTRVCVRRVPVRTRAAAAAHACVLHGAVAGPSCAPLGAIAAAACSCPVCTFGGRLLCESLHS